MYSGKGFYNPDALMATLSNHRKTQNHPLPYPFYWTAEERGTALFTPATPQITTGYHCVNSFTALSWFQDGQSNSISPPKKKIKIQLTSITVYQCQKTCVKSMAGAFPTNKNVSMKAKKCKPCLLISFRIISMTINVPVRPMPALNSKRKHSQFDLP